jgi:hypothetical protein
MRISRDPNHSLRRPSVAISVTLDVSVRGSKKPKKTPVAKRRTMPLKKRQACGRRYAAAIKKKAVKLYNKGHTIAEICRLEEMPNNIKVVRRWLLLEGTEIRSAKIPQYPRAKILKQLNSGKPRRAIIEEYGCSPKFLSNLANGKITP